MMTRFKYYLSQFRLNTQSRLILAVAVFFTIFDNYAFFTNVTAVYPVAFDNIGFLLSLAIVLTALTIFLLTLLSSRWTIKGVLITMLLISSLSNYFMNSYHVIIDETMIQNMLQTNVDESMDLLSLKQLFYFLFLGVLPSVLVYKSKIEYTSFKKESLSKVKVLSLSLLVILVLVFSFSKHYTSFFREHKPLRFYVNPSYWIFSVGKYAAMTLKDTKHVLIPIGMDAKVSATDTSRPKKLMIMVVGEAARADRFSLNGYERDTNPLLKREDILDFSNMHSCGTSTAVSVPCMFSVYNQSDYSYSKGLSTENVLDVLEHTQKVEVLWRDNNSDSKGVALRVPFEDYKSASNNTMCEGECRDEGMLTGLDTFIRDHGDKDLLIVLHQMGNHGPAYYKRYPKSFEKFTPVCETNQLEECTQEEIGNAYDNAILYTDYFLSKVIAFLKPYDASYETSMIYMSDHGESLGEHGLYLHGLPYFMAPDTQTNVAALMWFGEKTRSRLDIKQLHDNMDKTYSHDNLFHTLLGIFDVNTQVYNKEMDILNVESRS
jgi:lipid A ethanolaminephosphotransferase